MSLADGGLFGLFFRGSKPLRRSSYRLRRWSLRLLLHMSGKNLLSSTAQQKADGWNQNYIHACVLIGPT